jgi:hypothetical protein
MRREDRSIPSELVTGLLPIKRSVVPDYFHGQLCQERGETTVSFLNALQREVIPLLFGLTLHRYAV